MFELLKTDAHTKARLGRLTTAHGVVDTPVYMPVGTQGSVKALDPRELQEMGTQIILGNPPTNARYTNGSSTISINLRNHSAADLQTEAMPG